MAKLLVITGSARPLSANQKVVTTIIDTLAKRNTHEVTVANLAEMNLPYFDADMSPSQEAYKIPHQSVQAWSDKVKAADAVIFVMPEYNHSMSGVQKNAIDWLYNEWKGKPATVVAYGFYGGRHALDSFEFVNDVIKLDLVEPLTQLTFMKELRTDGSVEDETAVQTSLRATFDALDKKLGA